MYTFIYNCVQTGLICWAEMWLECNVYATMFFLLFLRLNGSVNGLKLRIYYIALHNLLNRNLNSKHHLYSWELQEHSYQGNIFVAFIGADYSRCL